MFQELVVLMDVEDHLSGGGGVSSHPSTYSLLCLAVLPLPQKYAKAAEWGNLFYHKRTHVYAMYPDMTSLYSAAVLDSTSYCQEHNDIIVVQFDEDKPNDVMGLIPLCHIPSHFVTPMPLTMSTSMMTMSVSLSSSYNHQSSASNKLHAVLSSPSLHKTIKQIITNSIGIKEPL